MFTPQRPRRLLALSLVAGAAAAGVPAAAAAAPVSASTTTSVPQTHSLTALHQTTSRRLRGMATQQATSLKTTTTFKAGAVTLNRTQSSLPITAGFSITGTAGSTLRNVVVTVTTSTGTHLDFPTVASAALSSAGTYAYQQSRYLPTGTYSVATAFTDGSGQRTASVATTVTVWGVGTKQVVFPAMNGRTSYPTTGQFATSDWVAGHTSAFPGMASGTTSQTNTADNKLSCINPAWSAPAADGTFGASRVTAANLASCGNDTSLWQTDLVTTRRADGSGFVLHAGDSVTATMTINDTQGAWPALWSWTETPTSTTIGHGEVDMLENHSMTNQTLEFTQWATTTRPNYCWPASSYVSGKPFLLRVDVTTSGVVYSIDGRTTCTLPGVAADWSAHLIVSLDIDNGRWHPAPAATQQSMSPFKVTDLSVWR